MKTNTTQRIFRLVILLLLFASNTIIAQQVSIGNQKTIGGSNDDSGVSIQKLNNGYVAILKSYSSISFDRTEARKGNMDYWLVGLNNDLTIAWQKTFGGSGTDEVLDMIVTPSKDIIIVGASDSPISDDKTVENYGSLDIWVVCTDSVGNIKWQNVYGGAYSEFFAAQIIKLSNNNYAIGTSSSSNISGNKTEDCRGYYDYWVFSIDSLGDKLWDKTFGGSDWDMFSDLVQVSDEEIIVSGTSASPISGDKSESKINDDPDFLSNEGKDLWLVKYNFVTNSIIWDKTLGGMEEEFLYTSAAFDGNYIYCFTSTISDVSGTKTAASFGGLDIWLNKMDTAGNVVLQKVYGGSDADQVASVIVDDNNNLLIGGTSRSPISGNKTGLSVTSDYWLLNIKPDGSIIWDKTINGNQGDLLVDILYNGGNNFIAIGTSISNISGDKTEDVRNTYPNTVYPDAWIIELSTDVGIGSTRSYYSEVEIFPNPSTDAILIKDKNNIIETIQLYDAQGKEVFNKRIQEKEYKLDVSNLSLGVYVVYGIMQDGEVFRAKFIKK